MDITGFNAGLQGAMGGANLVLGIADFNERKKQTAIQNERQAKMDAQNEELHKWDLRVKQEQLSDILDSRKRKQRLNDLNALEYDLSNGLGTPESYAEHLNKVMPSLAQGAYKGGEKQKFKRVLPAEQPGYVHLTVDTPEGEKPVTQYRSNDPEDQVLSLPMQTAFQYITDYKNLAEQVDGGNQNVKKSTEEMLKRIRSERLRLGDDSFLRQESEASAARLEHKRALEIEGVKAQGKKEIEVIKAKNALGLEGAKAKHAKELEYDKALAGAQEEGLKTATNVNQVAKIMLDADPSLTPEKAKQMAIQQTGVIGLGSKGSKSATMQIADAYFGALTKLYPKRGTEEVWKMALDKATKNKDPAKLRADLIADLTKAGIRADVTGATRPGDKEKILQQSVKLADDLLNEAGVEGSVGVTPDYIYNPKTGQLEQAQ